MPRRFAMLLSLDEDDREVSNGSFMVETGKTTGISTAAVLNDAGGFATRKHPTNNALPRPARFCQ
jgi:hypothetical protein